MAQLDLTGIRLKFDRAMEHLDRLRAESKARERKNPYGFSTKQKDGPGNEIQVTVYAKVRSSPPPTWGPIIGDVVQNLRNVLDYAIWDLTRPSKRSLKTQFPIFSDRCEYQVLSPPMLAGVSEAHRAVIQEAQPYLWDDGPHFHPLAVLRSLSNRDKHRTLIPMTVVHDLGFVAATNADTDFTFTVQGEAIEDGAPIFGFRAWPHNPSLEMYVEPGISFEESIEGSPIISTLDAIQHYVSYVVSRLSYI